MTPEQRLEMVTNQIDSLKRWLQRQTRSYEHAGDDTTAYALDDVTLHIIRIERTLKEQA